MDEYKVKIVELSVLPVVTDWTLTLGPAIEAVDHSLGSIDKGITDEDLPPLGNGCERINVSLEVLDDVDTSPLGWLKYIADSGQSFCHPLSLLAARASVEHRDAILEGGAFTIWVSPRTHQLTMLGFGWDGLINLNRIDAPFLRWGRGCRAAVLRSKNLLLKLPGS